VNVERMGGSFRLLDQQTLGVTLTNELLNWLAAGRLYIENNASSIRSQFGEGSDELRRFWNANSRASQFEGFRFAEALRDYAQHAASPLSGLKVSRRETQPRQVDVYVLRSALLESRMEWDARRRKLIEVLPEQIDVMPRVLEAMEGYRIIENEVLHILLGECVEAIPRLREGIEKVAPEPGQHPCVLRFEDRDDGVDGVQWAQSSFPNPADLDVFEAAAAAPDPLSVLKQRTVAAPSKNPGMTEANRQAGALISIWISHGGYSAELQQALDTSIAGDGARTVVPGLVNLCAHFAAMVGTLIGSSPLSLIGGFNMEAEPPERPPAPSP
jgi:hypothetical protein